MSGVLFCFVGVLFSAAKSEPKKVNPTTPAIAIEQILNTYKLTQKTADLVITRDLFSPDVPLSKRAVGNMPNGKSPEMVEPPAEEEEKPKIDPRVELENEIRRTIFYEGYIIMPPKNFALVSTNGEFFAVGAGDLLLERIKIMQIDKKAITVEVDSISFQIQLKGDNSNE